MIFPSWVRSVCGLSYTSIQQCFQVAGYSEESLVVQGCPSKTHDILVTCPDAVTQYLTNSLKGEGVSSIMVGIWSQELEAASHAVSAF